MLSAEELRYLETMRESAPLSKTRDRFYAKTKSAGPVTGLLSRDAYLDFAERRVRQFAPYMNKEGAIIDPYELAEKDYVTACYAKAGAILLKAGRCADLTTTVHAAADWALGCLGRRKVPNDHADFTTHMLVSVYRNRKEHASKAQRSNWGEILRTIDPELTYTQVERNMPLRHTRNWTTYAMHGEMMRYREGFGTDDFVAKYLPVQLLRFTSEGLYRDPNLPAAYDLAARHQLAGIMDEGYDGPWAELLLDLLRRGAVATLFMQSPTGECSFGGRSNQVVWNELTQCAILEREAALRMREGDEVWAGVFRRAARISLQAAELWDSEEQFPLFKNRYPVEVRYGWEFYAYYSTYCLYAAQIAASCYEVAEPKIAEYSAPCEVGGHVFYVPAFQRIYAVSTADTGNQHVGIDAWAQLAQDATGWVRYHQSGFLSETALSTGIPGASPQAPWAFYRAKADIAAPALPVSIGPLWCDDHGDWHSLSAFGRSQHQVFHELDEMGGPIDGEHSPWNVKVIFSPLEPDIFQVIYEAAEQAEDFGDDANVKGANIEETKRRALADICRQQGIGGTAKVKEAYRFHSHGVDVTWELEPVHENAVTAFAIRVPLFNTNGRDHGVISRNSHGFTMYYGSDSYRVEIMDKQEECRIQLFPGEAPNRNGHYRIAQWTVDQSNRLSMRFALQRGAGE